MRPLRNLSMPYKILSPKYYEEYLRETHKKIREQEQSDVVSEIVREIESHRSGLEEKERRDVSGK